MALAPPAQGVQGAELRALSAGGLGAWWSALPQERWTPGTNEVLEFHEVVQRFAQTMTVIPFRFPTLLEGEQSLRSFLEENSTEYRSALLPLDGLVQMEVLVEERRAPANTASGSGRAYLQERQAAARQLAETAEAARRAAGERVREWRQSETGRGLRCYALLPREEAPRVREQLGRLAAGAGLEVRLTGPWPPAEFFAPAREEQAKR